MIIFWANSLVRKDPNPVESPPSLHGGEYFSILNNVFRQIHKQSTLLISFL